MVRAPARQVSSSASSSARDQNHELKSWVLKKSSIMNEETEYYQLRRKQ